MLECVVYGVIIGIVVYALLVFLLRIWVKSDHHKRWLDDNEEPPTYI